MKMMNIKLISVILAISVFTGCSSKKDSVVYNDTDKSEKVTQTNNKQEDNIDKKLSKIQSVDSNVNEDNLGDINKDTYMNQVTSNINGKSVTLTSIHFGFDNYIMRDEMLPIVQENSVKISSITDSNSNVKVKIEGNCDEWGTDEYNFALGLKRTKAVKDVLITNGINASSIIVVSLGESNPRCTDQTASCWKQNRRVDHILLP